MSESTPPAARIDAEPVVALYDLLCPLPAASLLQRCLPDWATPPSYGYPLAEGVASAVLSGCLDRDTAAVAFGGWVRGYGRAVASPGAPDLVVRCAGIWQLGAHLAGTAIVANLLTDDAGADGWLAGLAKATVAELWPGWGQAVAPSPARQRVGLAAHRDIGTWHRSEPPAVGVHELIRCATTTGSQVPAAQHRLMHRMLQQPNRLWAVAAGLPLDGQS